MENMGSSLILQQNHLTMLTATVQLRVEVQSNSNNNSRFINVSGLATIPITARSLQGTNMPSK
jgi:hypothetical protein